MSEFNVGDKVYLECEVTEKDMSDNTYKLKYRNWRGNESFSNFVTNDVLHPTDEGINDAWELARKITLSTSDGGYSCEELQDIFGYRSPNSVLEVFTPQEALAKIKAYEKEHEEIKVGDVVKLKCGFIESIVTKVDGRIIYRLYRDGSCSTYIDKDDKKGLVKTGHFDSIDEFMRSAESEDKE